VRAALISSHTIIIESPTFTAVVLDSRYRRAGTQIGAVVDHKELQDAITGIETFDRSILRFRRARSDYRIRNVGNLVI